MANKHWEGKEGGEKISKWVSQVSRQMCQVPGPRQLNHVTPKINTQVQIAVKAASGREEARLLIQCNGDNRTFPMYLESF